MKHEKPPHAFEDHPLASPANPLNGPLADAFGKGASMFGRSFGTMQKEAMRFVNQRIEDNMKAAEDFGACRSLPDVFSVQQRWFASMAKAYAEEWQRCSALMTEVARESTDAVETEVRKHRPDLPH